MKSEVKGPLAAIVVVAVLIGVGLAVYFTLFNEHKVSQAEYAAHMGGGPTQYVPAASGGGVRGGGAPGGGAPGGRQ